MTLPHEEAVIHLKLAEEQEQAAFGTDAESAAIRIAIASFHAQMAIANALLGVVRELDFIGSRMESRP